MGPENPSITAEQESPKHTQRTICVKFVEYARLSFSAPIRLLITTVAPVEITEKITGNRFITEFAEPTAATEFSLYPESTAEFKKPIRRFATVSNKSGMAKEKRLIVPNELVTEKMLLRLLVFCKTTVFRGRKPCILFKNP